MYGGKTFLGVIPARGGSKGIPKKNIMNIGGLPLIEYSIRSAQKSKYLDRIIVSTDDVEIKEVAIKAGAEVPFLRPKYLAEDDSKTISAIIDVLERVEESYDYVVVLQPTQPLRRNLHIDESIEYIVNCNSKSLVSISEVRDHPILMRTIDEDGKLKSLIGTRSDIRRQDFKKIYKVNGAIYINKIDEDLNLNTSLNDNKTGYIMDKKFDIDIDDFEDIELFKVRLKELQIL